MPTKSLLDWKTVADAADASTDIYTNGENKDFIYWRKVELFWLAGELAAAIRVDKNRRTAFVAIRGTSLIGNWFFTNFQAYFRKFQVVDESLSKALQTPYQGGAYRAPVHGSLHQGFYRAFSWLWYGTEPILGHTEPDRSVGITRLLRYLALFALLPVFLFFVLESFSAALVVTLAVCFIFVTLESGVWEDVFKVVPQIEGTEPFKRLAWLNAFDRVVFTGHSLGGAIAIIAFCVYRCWCHSDPKRNDNAVLVTFGAPRVGDVKFMEEFCRENSGRFHHIVHPGDPVPELPPNGMLELHYRRFWTRGLLGFGVIFLYPLWRTIALLYRNQRAARWTGESLTEIGPNASKSLKFAHHSMSKVYRPWAQMKKSLHGDN